MISPNPGKIICLFLLLTCMTTALQAQTYYVYVAAESEDEVYMTTYNADTQQGVVADTMGVGIFPTEIEGPHGLNVGLEGEYWYATVAHGNPYGWLYKFKTGTNEFIKRTELGMFPASLEISEATGLLYVVNFNLHGDHEPSTVSVVDPEAMEVVGEIPTGIMPHGSRITDDGRYQYHVSMMTDELVEINMAAMNVSRRLTLADSLSQHSKGAPPQPICKPTWADPHPSKSMVYVACNGSDKILEIDRNNWEITRTFESGEGTAPYNLEVSHDGNLLVASYKSKGATGVWYLDSGKEIAVINNSRKVSHGVSISSDNKIAFISVEGVGGEAGSVDIIDLNTLELAEVIEVGKQAGGIIFWKKES